MPLAVELEEAVAEEVAEEERLVAVAATRGAAALVRPNLRLNEPVAAVAVEQRPSRWRPSPRKENYHKERRRLPPGTQSGRGLRP